MKKTSQKKTSTLKPVVYVVGDVHGCAAELTDLLAKITIDAGAVPIEIYMIGDLIDKGPHPVDVTKMVMSQFQDMTITSILGNHEEKYIRWLVRERESKANGGENPIQKHYDYTGLEPFWDFFRSLPTHIHLPRFNVLLVHAGIEPRMAMLPPQNIESCRRHEKNLLRTRYVNPRGNMVPLGEENTEAGDRWWADVYDGRFGTVIYGHQAFPEVAFAKHAIGIDTGCVYGNKLTAIRLDENGNHKLVQVDAKQKYCLAYDEEAEG